MKKLRIYKNDLINLLYAIFIVSGVIKSVLYYIGIPKVLDITAISALLIIGDITIVMISRKKAKLSIGKKQFDYLILIFTFQFMVFASLLYTYSLGFGFYKSFLLLLNIIAFCYPLIRPSITLESFFRIIYKFIVPFSVFIIFLNLVRWTPYRSLINIERADEIRGHYLTIGMFLGLIATYNIVFKRQLKANLITKILLPVFLLVISSARGPLIFFVIVLIVLFIIRVKRIRFKIKKWHALILFLLMGFVLLTPLRDSFFNLFTRTITRFYVMFFESDGGQSISERVDFIRFSFDKIFDGINHVFFGYGIGSFMYLYSGVDGRGYPHNILLESWFELGFFGFLVITIFIVLIFFYRTKNLGSKLLLVFLLLCYSKSGGLEDIRIIYGLYSLYIGSLYNNENLLRL
ncbi:O-antigen ligase family protein [Flagellimonas marinaquae]|uniref:O-antigen ligase family protein n=1 Tax=Flagellimonas aurea TaxID=2915619 RepID=UPI001CE15CA8|nr:O-antigen ligase family protein [Allomuricauda aquimarina]